MKGKSLCNYCSYSIDEDLCSCKDYCSNSDKFDGIEIPAAPSGWRNVREDLQKEFNSESFVFNVCMSYRHDFGLLNDADRGRIAFECREWLRAILNNLPAPPKEEI
jgi:hypothetical protein